jgi:hypothetical protein
MAPETLGSSNDHRRRLAMAFGQGIWRAQEGGYQVISPAADPGFVRCRAKSTMPGKGAGA